MLTVDYDRLGLRAGDRLLDLGCGGGRHAFEALRRGAPGVAPPPPPPPVLGGQGRGGGDNPPDPGRPPLPPRFLAGAIPHPSPPVRFAERPPHPLTGKRLVMYPTKPAAALARPKEPARAAA